jgi:hypothetical protein
MPQYDALTQLWGALLANSPPYIHFPDSKKFLSSFCLVLEMFIRRIFYISLRQKIMRVAQLAPRIQRVFFW